MFRGLYWLRYLAGWLSLGLGGVVWPAHAHDVPPSTVMLDLGRSSIQVDMDVPLSELTAALGQPMPPVPEAWLQAQRVGLQRYFEDHWGLQTPDGSTGAQTPGQFAARCQSPRAPCPAASAQ